MSGNHAEEEEEEEEEERDDGRADERERTVERSLLWVMDAFSTPVTAQPCMENAESGKGSRRSITNAFQFQPADSSAIH